MDERENGRTPELIGLRAKELRRRRGLTLDQLAAGTGLSKGHLSRFERGQKSLSVSALIRLASGLDVSVGYLLGDETDPDEVRIVHAAEVELQQAPAANGGYLFSALSSSAELGPRYDVFTLVLPREGYRQSRAHHSGREMIYVVSGRVRFTVGQRETVLEEHDYVEFPGHQQHDLQSLAEESRLLVVVISDDRTA